VAIDALSDDGSERPAARGLRVRLGRAKYVLQRIVVRYVLLPLRGVRVHPTVEFRNVHFDGGPVVIENHCRLMGYPRMRIGRGVHVGPHVHAQGDITIDDGVWIGPRTTLWGRDHGFEPGVPIRSQPHRTEPIRIERDAEVGAGSIVLRGVTVGARARLGAGSVCTRDVMPDARVAGSPAKAVVDGGPTLAGAGAGRESDEDG
jgi:acetyltransferase-like isoleucine patch superfamily enzyme